MVDEHIPSYHVRKAFQLRPQAKVIILEIARSKTLIQKTDPLYQLFSKKHAETNDSPRGDLAMAIFFAKGIGKFVQVIDGRVRDVGNLLYSADLVGHRSDDSDVRLRCKLPEHTGKPFWSHPDIVVQKKEEFPFGSLYALIAPFGKAQIALIFDKSVLRGFFRQFF